MKKNVTFICLFLNFYFLLFNFVKAQTPLSGAIFSNTTLTKAKSPYIVTDTVVVYPGVTLTIEPGVTVKFADKQELEIRQAKLIALGTKTDSITFTSNSATPKPGIFSGIYFNGGNFSGTFNFCNFYYGDGCVRSIQTGIVKNSKFMYNVVGIDGGYATVDSCIFKKNTNGLRSDGTVTNCNFINNNTGINSNYVNAINCIINFNDFGFTTSNGGCIIDKCTIKFNNYGIGFSTSEGGNTYKNNIVDSNKIGGICITWYDSVYNCIIRYNHIGISDSLMGGNQSYIVKNIIENNTYGFRIVQSLESFKIYCNKICNNTVYDFYYNFATDNINIAYNYWCSIDSSTIKSHIYDGYNNQKYGLVHFLPIDTGKCYLTGCDLQVTASIINATCDTCHNGSATAQVENGLAPFTWTWYTSPLQSTQTATKLKSGIYTVCVTDAKGCSACNHSVFIDSTNCTGFSITANDSNETCSSCADGYAWVKVRGGRPPYKYTWYTSPLQATDTAKGLTHGTYHVCVTDLYGCTACDSVTIQTGHCSAHFDLYPTSTPHVYNAVNRASGVAPLTYLWSWGDGSYDSTAYPSHTYSSAGFYKICLTITDFAGCKNTFCNSYYLQKSNNPIIQVNVLSAGINQLTMNNPQLTIYPNPANQLTAISYELPARTFVNISIYDLTGRQVADIVNEMQVKGPHSIKYNTANLKSGVYIVTIRNYELGIRNYKLVISR